LGEVVSGMRILHIVQRYWPAEGGAERHLGELSERLAADGHDVTVLTTDALDIELFWNAGRRRIDENHEVHAGVEIIRLPVHHLPVAPLGYPAWRRLLWTLSKSGLATNAMLERLSRYTPSVPDLRRWLRLTEEPFDLVAGMTICFEPLLSAGLDFARTRGIPFVAYPLTHLGAGSVPGQDPVSSFYTMRHQVDLVLNSDAAILQTPTEAQFYIERGLPQARAHVAGPGVNPEEILGGDAARFRRAMGLEGPIVTAIGSMSFDKGTETLVEAVEHLWQQGVSVNLVLAGTVLGPFEYFLAQLTPETRERIHLLGSIDEDTKRDLLAATDVLVMASRTDSFGITYLEAWLYAKPVIGAQVWGIDDVIDDGVDGLLVPFGDITALAQAIEGVLTDPAAAAEMGRRGKKKVYAEHTWTQKYAITRRVYAALTQSE
jgi:glycosyltransferase involved in cell wall biosynthesis